MDAGWAAAETSISGTALVELGGASRVAGARGALETARAESVAAVRLLRRRQRQVKAACVAPMPQQRGWRQRHTRRQVEVGGRRASCARQRVAQRG